MTSTHMQTQPTTDKLTDLAPRERADTVLGGTGGRSTWKLAANHNEILATPAETTSPPASC